MRQRFKGTFQHSNYGKNDVTVLAKDVGEAFILLMADLIKNGLEHDRNLVMITNLDTNTMYVFNDYTYCSDNIIDEIISTLDEHKIPNPVHIDQIMTEFEEKSAEFKVSVYRTAILNMFHDDCSKPSINIYIAEAMGYDETLKVNYFTKPIHKIPMD